MRILFDLAAFAALFFMLRYRVHIHVEYEPRQRTRRMSRSKSPLPVAPAPPSPVSAQMLADLKSALVNLGCGKEEASRGALAAMAQGPGDFDTLILRALQAREPGRQRRAL